MSLTPHVKSHYREATKKYGQIIQVPVIDVRDGIAERMMGMSMIKATNRSKYITYTEYHRSYKPKTNI
jgi:hypothetical protein